MLLAQNSCVTRAKLWTFFKERNSPDSSRRSTIVVFTSICFAFNPYGGHLITDSCWPSSPRGSAKVKPVLVWEQEVKPRCPHMTFQFPTLPSYAAMCAVSWWFFWSSLSRFNLKTENVENFFLASSVLLEKPHSISRCRPDRNSEIIQFPNSHLAYV